MFYEIIYTRCGEGIDIAKGGSVIHNAGFKVYSCSEELLKDKSVDISYLNSVMTQKAPYSFPDFSDDAYFFFTPVTGKCLFVNFHPIPQDLNATGNYSKRSGNYINQIFIGSLLEDYPYEMFGNVKIWDAKGRGEAYYYENSPKPLPSRSLIVDDIGSIGIGEIEEFVTEQRRKILKKAIAFILSQFSFPPEERKYLVIKDSDSRKIELWIAAIESAFSPRMASGLPFVTRMNNLTTENRYMVDSVGRYQPQIDLRNASLKQRYRAMIVGVDSRDKDGVREAKVKPSQPFVLLDGETNTFYGEVSDEHPYYQYVTTYDDDNVHFCREFLQMFDFHEPTKDVLRLFEAFQELKEYEKAGRVESLSDAVAVMKQYKMLRTSCSKGIYNLIKSNSATILKQDVVKSIAILSWIENVSRLFGDETGKTYVKNLLSNAYAETVFTSPNSVSVSAFDHVIQNCQYSAEVYQNLLSSESFNLFRSRMSTYADSDWIAFWKTVLKAMDYAGQYDTKALNTYFIWGIRFLYRSGDMEGFSWMISKYSQRNAEVAYKQMLTEASATKDALYSQVLIQTMLSTLPDSGVSEKGILGVYDLLKEYHLETNIVMVLERRARGLNSIKEKEQFLEEVLSDQRFAKCNLSSVLLSLDNGLLITDKLAFKVAALIQKNRRNNEKCINSAHIYALRVIEKYQDSKDFKAKLQELHFQGFPSIKNEEYCDFLIQRVLDKGKAGSGFDDVLMYCSYSPFYVDRLLDESFKYIGKRNETVVNQVFRTMELMQKQKNPYSQVLYNSLVGKCARLKNFDKGTVAIMDSIEQASTKQCFSSIVKDARLLYEQENQKKSFFGRLFSKRDDEEDDE